MLRVMRLPDDHRYALSWFSTTNTKWTATFRPLFGPFGLTNGALSSPLEITSIDGIITDGEKDPLGDRSVSHRQISGDVSFLPFERVQVSMPKDIYKVFSTRQFGSSTLCHYTHVLTPGSEFKNEDWNVYGSRTIGHMARMDQYGNWVAGYCSRYKVGAPAFTGRLEFKSMLPNGTYRKTTTNVTTPEAFFGAIPVKLTSGTAYSTDIYRPLNQTISAYAIAAQLGVIPEAQSTFFPDYVPEVPYIWSDLVQSCIDQVRYVDTNTLSFVSELRDVSKMIPKIPFGDDLLNPKKWANAYLAMRYGLNLTASDIRALGEGVYRAMTDIKTLANHKVMFSSRTATGYLAGMSYTDTYHYKVTCDPIDAPGMGAVRLLDGWGLYPTPARLWDMVPLSFVVDWGLKVSDYLQQVDSDLLKGFFNVLSVCWSRKVVITLPITKLFPSANVTGNILLTKYVRGTSPTLHPIAFRLDTASEFHNYSEALALIIARKR